MKVNMLNPSELPEPSIEFRNIFDSYLDLCEFNDEQRFGLLFFLGATLPGKLGSAQPNTDEFRSILHSMSLYSKSSGDFSDYGDLNDAIFSSWIYNANLAISKITSDDSSIDENLRTIPNSSIIIGKADPRVDFLNRFKEDSFCLNVVQNLNDEIFSKVGLHLKEKDYSNTRAYEAGFAYRMMMLNLDIKGTTYLLSRITSFMSPLFQSLFYAPILYTSNPQAFKANHLFSQVLNNFYGGQDSALFPIAQSIHRYHQLIFYKERSTELRDEWLFNKKVDEGSALMVFFNAMNIVKTDLKQNASSIKSSGQVFGKELIDAKISSTEFLKAILNIIKSKYSINGYDEFLSDSDSKWNNSWNHKGDYIQFLVILYYETSLHALVTQEII